MTIAWFTPFDHHSAIGRFSALVTKELAQHVLVDIWHPRAERVRGSDLRTISFDGNTLDRGRLKGYDLIVYNFGNHFPYHGDMLSVCQDVPGVCVMHDFVMHHFFAAYYLEHLKQKDAYISTMSRLYGTEGRIAAAASLEAGVPRLWETDTVTSFPLFEEIVRHADGVVTHSEFFAGAVRRVFGGPVTKIPLAYDRVADKSPISRSELGLSADEVVLLTVGHVNRNKCIHLVIQAAAEIRGRLPEVKFKYCVVGPASHEYLNELEAQIATVSLGEIVRLVGYVNDEVLNAYLTHADVCVNLRAPAIEGASASAIEEMLHGKPVVVCDAGFYREIPDECVWKVPARPQTDALVNALSRLMSDRGTRHLLGSRARSFAAETFRADRYALSLLEFAWEVRRSRPIIHLSREIGREVARMGVSKGANLPARLARECWNLFCPKNGL